MIMKVFLSWLSSNICITIKPHPLRLFSKDQSFQDQCYGKPWLLIAAYDGWLFWHLTNQCKCKNIQQRHPLLWVVCLFWHLIMTEWLTEWLWHPLSTKWFDLTQPAETQRNGGSLAGLQKINKLQCRDLQLHRGQLNFSVCNILCFLYLKAQI